MILAPTWPWNLRGYRLFLDDVAEVWTILGSGEPLAQRRARKVEPGTLAHLDALLAATRESGTEGRVILVHDDGTGNDATKLVDVAAPGVVAFTLTGPGAALHVDRVHRTGWIEWQDPGVGHDVLKALESSRVRPRMSLVWKPYQVRFVPATRDVHREKMKLRWAVTGVVAAVISAVAAVIGLPALL